MTCEVRQLLSSRYSGLACLRSISYCTNRTAFYWVNMWQVCLLLCVWFLPS